MIFDYNEILEASHPYYLYWHNGPITPHMWFVSYHRCRHMYRVRLLLQLNEQWGEKYAEWIAKVDQKMEELQKANEML